MLDLKKALLTQLKYRTFIIHHKAILDFIYFYIASDKKIAILIMTLL